MKLLNLLKVQLQKKSVGTLVLGKKDAFREIFFEKDLVYLCDDLYSGKIDAAGLADTGIFRGRLSAAQLENILGSFDLRTRMLPKVLFDQGFIGKDGLEDLALRHSREELLQLLMRNSESFHFQDGRVPERLLTAEGMAVRTPLRLSELIDDVGSRLETIKAIHEILPSSDESFVLTAEGMAYRQQHTELFALQRLFGLIDGFRKLNSLIDDSCLFEHFLLSLICECLERGYLKKVILPELKGISTSRMTPEQAKRHLPHFKNAVKYGADQLAARERLAVVYETLGDHEQAVIQYNFVGDALFRMRKTVQAVKAYQRALALKPDEVLIVDKIIRIYQEAADQEILNGNVREATELLENALRVRPEDRELFQKLVELLAREKKTRQLSELCDRVIAYTRNSGQPEVAISACRQVLAHIPHHPAFVKKLANVYLDMGESHKAAAELGALARSYMKWGQPQRTLELLHKIKLIGKMNPELVRLRKNLKKEVKVSRRPRKRRTVAVTLFLGLLVVFAAYQAWGYVAWSEIRSSAIALAASTGAAGTEPGAGQQDPGGGGTETSLLPDSAEKGNLDLASRCQDFIKRFPISIFQAEAEKLERHARERASSLASRLRERKERILADAILLAAEGNREAVSATLKPLLGLEEGDSFRTRAEALQADVESLEKSAEELYREAKALEQRADWSEAYKTYQILRKTFPNSQRTKEVMLPILLESVPSQATIHAVDFKGTQELLGKTPLVLHMEPGELMEVEISAPGYFPLRADVEAQDGSFELFFLFRKAVLSVVLGDSLEFDPVADGNLALCATRQGPLHAVDLTSGAIAWSAKRTNLKNLTAPPLVTPEGIYVVWNDSEIWLLERNPRGKEAVIKAQTGLEGFASCPALVLEHNLFVVGTRRKSLHLFERQNLKTVSQIALDASPLSLAPLGPSTVAATTESGTILAIELVSEKILWKQLFSPPPLTVPVFLAPTLALVSADWHLHFLDPTNGVSQRVFPLSKAHKVALRPLGKHAFFVEGIDQLSKLSPRTGDLVAGRSLGFEADFIKHVGSDLVVGHGDSRQLVVLDARTLEPRWATRTISSTRRVAASPQALLVVTEDGRLVIYPNGRE